jgi:endonuclease III
MPLGKFLLGLLYVFSDGEFPKSYGGERWLDVVQCLIMVILSEQYEQDFMQISEKLQNNCGYIFTEVAVAEKITKAQEIAQLKVLLKKYGVPADFFA